ncbi:MAG TPA: GGDEF domain-containing protein [Trebonia sp.]|nr:GGDEF domain-containing protein [Trebonia sp.]
MKASSLIGRLRTCWAVRDWAWWRLPPVLRAYVAVQPVAALVVIGVVAIHTTWHVQDVTKFAVLLCCGMISVASTPRIMYSFPGLTRDFSSIWIVPTAILLPPIYAAIVPIFFVATLHLYVHRGVMHRMVFTAATLSLSYVGASLLFRLFPASFAGGDVGTGMHAFTWCIAVAICEILGCRVQHFLIVGAVKLSNPAIRVLAGELDRDALQALFVETDLGVLVTLAVGLSPALVVIALPTVLLVRRFLVFPILEAQSRIDAKTGLLNVSTWETEAESELSRSVRNRNPVALALVDIDHFKAVNDTYGHLVGDRVLKAIAEALAGQSRGYDRVGRFGGEEFVLLLAQTTAHDACRIAERLRDFVASLEIPVDDRPNAPAVKVTISIGVTAMARGGRYELTDLLAASDSAMYAAKQAGRNQVAFAHPMLDMGIDAAWSSDQAAGATDSDTYPAAGPAGSPISSSPLSGHRVVIVQTDQAASSLCP